MTPKLLERLTRLLPMLGSDRDFEVLSTVYAIRRSLASENLDLHDLAKLLSNGSGIRNEAASAWTRDYDAYWSAAREARRADAAEYEAKRAAQEAEYEAQRAADEAERARWAAEATRWATREEAQRAAQV